MPRLLNREEPVDESVFPGRTVNTLTASGL
jgi:hypothetical protein